MEYQIVHNRVQDDNDNDNDNDNDSQHLSNEQNKKFYISFSTSQANIISRMLPKGYSIQIERDNKNKRNNSKKKSRVSKKQPITNLIEVEEPSERMIKVKSAQRYIEDLSNLSNYSRAASQGYYQEIEDFMKPCLRILHMLKNHKTSWPFKEPVDPVALNIPNYLQIIQEPMDLQTLQRNLKLKVYVTPTQFHADIGKIIRNSYEFNKNNVDFCKLTNQFEQYYNKISSDSQIRSVSFQNSNVNQVDLKKKKSKPIAKPSEYQFREANENQPATLAQKKTLANQIKKLPREQLKQVIEIVYEGKAPAEELNIENLPVAKIRQLQRFVRQKASLFEARNNIKDQDQDIENDRNDQSSFESDSDS